MFLVITVPNNREDGGRVNIVAPRFMTEDPVKALKVAREACNDGLSEFVENVFIYELVPDKTYNLHDAAALPNLGNKILVYKACRPSWRHHWEETFFNSLLTMQKFSRELALK